MFDETLSSTAARADDQGVTVRVRLSSADLGLLIRQGSVTIPQRVTLGPLGSVHVVQCDVDLI